MGWIRAWSRWHLIDCAGQGENGMKVDKQASGATKGRGKGESRHWFWYLVLAVAFIDCAGIYVFQSEHPFRDREHYSQMVLLAAISTTLVTAPLIRFLSHGWQDRYEEFRNRLTDGALNAYLLQFWERRARKVNQQIFDNSALMQDEAGRLFDLIYREQYGQSVFMMPALLLLLTTLAGSFLVIMIGMEKYQLSMIETKVAIAAIAGAYMFAVSDMVLSVRRKSLNVADIYWYVLRLVLAVPIGIAATASAPGATAATVALGLGTFPMDTLTKLLRRLTDKPLNVAETDQAPDLIKLEGVTVPIASSLSAEGVESVEQLLGMDPILLAIRTGLPFKFILQLSAQAVVWRHLGEAAGRLVPIDLAYAQQVARLVQAVDDRPELRKNLLSAVATRLKNGAGDTVLEDDTILFILRSVADDSYTKFLMSSYGSTEAAKTAGLPP